MSSKSISCIVVCEKRLPVGIVSERDIVLAMEKVLGGAPAPKTAIEVMSGPVLTIGTAATVHEMMMLVDESPSRSVGKMVVVVDSSGGLVGIVTQTDMLRAHAWDLDIAQQTAHRLVAQAESPSSEGD